MARHKGIKGSCYQGSQILLTTKHGKSLAIAPPFLETLGATIEEYVVDTDQLGTFSGEVDRVGNALECARKKCEWSLNQPGHTAELALASEGSFGTHPLIPFLPCDQEILYFIDQKRDFHLYLAHISEKTNYRTEAITSREALHQFAAQALFPSHALIMRPNNRETRHPLFKGLTSRQALDDAYTACSQWSEDGVVWLETDMRAHHNPSRMKVIAELAQTLAARLNTLCPGCHYPGWGQIRYEKGLICGCCGTETELVKSEIFGCVKCDYAEHKERADGQREANPANCPHCNP